VTSRTARLRVTSATGAVNPPGRISDLGLASQLRASAISLAQPEWNQTGIAGAKLWHGCWFDPVSERN
jgi:hypothetical protein